MPWFLHTSYTVSDLRRRSYRVGDEVLLDRSILISKRIADVSQLESKPLSIPNTLSSRSSKQTTTLPAELQAVELNIALTTTNMRLVTYSPENATSFAKKGADGEAIVKSYIAQDPHGRIYEVSEPLDMSSAKIFQDIYLQLEFKKSGLNPNFLGFVKDLKGSYRMVFKLVAHTSPKRFDSIEFGYFQTPFNINDPLRLNTLLQMELFLTKMRQHKPEYLTESVDPNTIQAVDNLKSTTLLSAIISEIPFLISPTGQLSLQGYFSTKSINHHDWLSDRHPSRNYEYSPRSPYYLGSLAQATHFNWWSRETHIRTFFLLLASPEVRTKYIFFLYQRNKKAWWDLYKSFEFWSHENTLLVKEFNEIFNEVKIQNVNSQHWQEMASGRDSYTFSNNKSAKYHYSKHGKISAKDENSLESFSLDDYVRAANEFIHEPLDQHSFIFQRKDRALVKVNVKTQEVVVFALSGKLITYFYYEKEMNNGYSSLEYALYEIETNRQAEKAISEESKKRNN